MLYKISLGLHVITAIVSLTLFVLRANWKLKNNQTRLSQRWVKILPHVNDTLLLTAGIIMAVMIQQYPFVHAWITVKIIALLVYIGLGMVVLKARISYPGRFAITLLAIATFGFIVSVAITKSPFGVFFLL